MKIVIVEELITFEELKKIAQEFYVSMIKGAVDIEREIVAFGGEYHMDANLALLDRGSQQSNIWGFNLLLEKQGDEWIEYTSLINIRPLKGNKGMEIIDPNIRDKVKKIVNKKIQR